MGIKTITKQIISSAEYSQNEIEPPVHRLVTGVNGEMMFGVSIFGFNLTEIRKMFDVYLYQ